MLKDLIDKIEQLHIDLESALNDAVEITENLKDEYDILKSTNWFPIKDCLPSEYKLYLVRVVNNEKADKIILAEYKRCYNTHVDFWENEEVKSGELEVVEFCEIPE